jgi:predicted transcriptional regulator
MNVTLLIDAIVRQTTILIAELATASGTRAPLAHTANQVFLDLVRELKEQGLGNKVIADMFGMALRTYHHKVQRLSESSTFRGKSLWAAVLAYVEERRTTSRADVLRRFVGDDAATVRSVLADLVDSGLVYRSGQGDATQYRARELEELKAPDESLERTANLVWVAVNRYGPATAAELRDVVPLDDAKLRQILDKLVEAGRVERQLAGSEASYTCDSCLLGLGNSFGWEAAVFDHYQAMVTAICCKLRTGSTEAASKDLIGGSTYSYDVWDGHPHQAEVSEFLGETRRRAVALREKVEAFNRGRERPPESRAERFISYVGQTVLLQGDQGENA